MKPFICYLTGHRLAISTPTCYHVKRIPEQDEWNCCEIEIWTLPDIFAHASQLKKRACIRCGSIIWWNISHLRMLISSLRASAEHDHGTYILLRSWPKTITSAFQLLSSIKRWTSSNIYKGCIRTSTSSPFLSFPLQLSVCFCANTKLLAFSF